MLTLTIGELSRRCGVAASTLRFYERKGLISSHRTAGNQRRYDDNAAVDGDDLPGRRFRISRNPGTQVPAPRAFGRWLEIQSQSGFPCRAVAISACRDASTAAKP